MILASNSYADWFKPQPAWAQAPITGDSTLPTIINFDVAQPILDSASLCAGALPISPFGSMNYVKIPCDFPLYRAGLICKKTLFSNGMSTSSLERVDCRCIEINEWSLLYTCTCYSGAFIKAHVSCGVVESEQRCENCDTRTVGTNPPAVDHSYEGNRRIFDQLNNYHCKIHQPAYSSSLAAHMLSCSHCNKGSKSHTTFTCSYIDRPGEFQTAS